VEEEAFHLMASWTRKDRERLRKRYSPQRYSLLPPLRPHLQNVQNLTVIAGELGIKLSTISLWQTFHIQTITVDKW
jgi:hypothetical protein